MASHLGYPMICDETSYLISLVISVNPRYQIVEVNLLVLLQVSSRIHLSVYDCPLVIAFYMVVDMAF
jgi:hypothetical protein